MFFAIRIITKIVHGTQQTQFSTTRALVERRLIIADVLRSRKVINKICRHGFGNWGDIADFVGSGKSR